MKVLSYKKVTLGELDAYQFTIFEFKRVCSFIVYYFKGKGWQDRFHTHAFNAVSIRVFGTYRFRDLIDGKVVEGVRNDRVKYFPRATNHMLGPSNGCMTLLFAGPWSATWQETKDGETRTLGWGRQRVNDEQQTDNYNAES